MELATSESESWLVQDELTYSPQIVAFLTGSQEWSKLECWMATVWML